MQLLKTLCSIHAPSGNEDAMTSFVLDYIHTSRNNWKFPCEIFHGENFQNCIVVVFGNPRTAVYAHMDNIGFTVRYNNGLVKIGHPEIKDGYRLTGTDNTGFIECVLVRDEEKNIGYKASREIERGTDLSFKANWREDEEYVQCCYMDNRLGVWNALRLCETLENGAVVFSCWEEHGGGSVGYIARFLYEHYAIRQALISDITWITEGVLPGKGVVVSLRDSGIPRRSFVKKIIELTKKSKIPFQLEVEGSGGSDGTELQKQPYPIDWCFIGAGENFVHSPDEKVHKKDIAAMTQIYSYLMKAL